MRLRFREFWSRLAATTAWLLRPRELLLRSEGRVRYVVLSTAHQAMAGTAVLLLTGWLTYSSITLLIHSNLLDDKDTQLREAKIAYLGLIAEVGESYDSFTTLSDHIAAGAEASPDPVEESGVVTGGSIEARLRQSEAERARIFTGHPALQAKLRRFGDDLRVLAERNRNLNETVETLERKIQLASAEKVELIEGRRQLQTRLDKAKTTIAKAAEHNEMLEANLTRLEDRIALAYPGEGDQQAALEREVADLKRELAKSDGKRTLEERIGSIFAALSGMIGQRDDLKVARSELRKRVQVLEARLTELQESHQTMVQQLAERTRSGVDEVEKTVAMTGLDVEMLLERAAPEASGVGGPFIPADQTADPGILLSSVADLDSAVERWERLQFILRSLPLSAPVDNYWISSYFGKRKDPMTGRRAMHEGIDMSGPLRSAVLATAPGRVVYAGRNGSYGRMVEIDHGLGVHTRYGHLNAITVSTGDMVDYRDKIGLLGNSGRSTGPHLHYEILVDGVPYDPTNFLKAGRYVFKG